MPTTRLHQREGSGSGRPGGEQGTPEIHRGQEPPGQEGTQEVTCGRISVILMVGRILDLGLDSWLCSVMTLDMFVL